MASTTQEPEQERSHSNIGRATIPRVSRWLMKAEPDSRLEKGIDISFSIDAFAAAPNQTTAWEGVRNAEARNIMRDKMKIGDCVLFYHSSCKVPGVAGLAKVVREGYPDWSAWDEKHPYFDPKTDRNNPKWYMTDVRLTHRLPHLVPLSLLNQLKADPTRMMQMPFLSQDHFKAISEMQLLIRGRLSVQPVSETAFDAIRLLGENGGWEEWQTGQDTIKAGKIAESAEKKRKKGEEASEELDAQSLSQRRSEVSGDTRSTRRSKRMKKR